MNLSGETKETKTRVADLFHSGKLVYKLFFSYFHRKFIFMGNANYCYFHSKIFSILSFKRLYMFLNAYAYKKKKRV